MAHGAPIHTVGETQSTNVLVRSMVQQGERLPFWVRAERQTAGRGRRGRTWQGVDGNLYLSGAFGVRCGPLVAAQASLVTGVAVATALEGWVDPGLISLKWPNDVLVDGAKAAGILLECEPSADGGGLIIIIGIGVNVVAAPDGLDYPAAALRAHCLSHGGEDGAALTAECVGAAVAMAVGAGLQAWVQDGFATPRQNWLARGHGLGGLVRVVRPGGALVGRFVDLGDEGGLVVEGEDGQTHTVTAGDVVYDGETRVRTVSE